MPTSPGTSSNQPLTPQQTLEKVTGLITELGDELPETTEPDVSAARPAATEPEPPETTPPETSESAEPAQEDDDTMLVVPVDGEPTNVTLRELKDSFAYKGHNTRTAQELAEKEKRLEPEIRQRVEAEVQGERSQYQQGLQQLRQVLEQLQGEPDWVALHTQLPPEDFLKRKADWEASKAQLEQLKAHERQVAEQAASEQAKAYTTYLRGEQDKLQAAIPEWKEPEVAKAEQAKLLAHAKVYGYTEQDVRSVTDHRALLVLRDAMRYRELHREVSPQAKARTASIKTARPGTPSRPRPNEQFQKKVERAAKSGRQRDAMDAIADLLPDD